MKFSTLFFVLTCAACHKSAPATPAPIAPAPAAKVEIPPADPELGKIDLSTLHLSHVRDRLAHLPANVPADATLTTAIALAAQDLLAVREMAVLHQEPLPSERPWQSADRFAQTVWQPKPDCEADPGDLKVLYLQSLKKFKHPEKYAIWDAQLQCCPDLEKCPQQELATCQKQTADEASALAQQIQAEIQKLAPLNLPAEVTMVALDASPVKGQRTDLFERAVAEHAVKQPKWALRRYDFYRMGEAGFPPGHFRPGEPNVAKWAEKARLGEVSEPQLTLWGWSVALLVAREPTRQGKSDPAVLKELTQKACQLMAEQNRQEWRENLLKGAHIRWDRAAIQQQFGAAILAKLPTGRVQQGLPPPE